MIDSDGLRLQRLIEKRRMALGLTPSRWRTAWYRLAITAAVLGGWLL